MSRQATLELVIKREGVAVAEKNLTQMGATGEAAAKRVETAFSSTDRAAMKLADSMRRMRETSQSNAMASMISATDPFQKQARSIAEATGAAEKHHLAIGRINMAFEHLGAEAVGVNTKMASIAAHFFEFGVGGPVTLGVLGGLAAITIAWEKLTESARKAHEEFKKQLDILRDIKREQDLGVEGEAGASVKAARARLGVLANTVNFNQRMIDAGGLQGQSLAFAMQARDAAAKEYTEIAILAQAGEKKVTEVHEEEAKKREALLEKQWHDWQELMAKKIEAMKATEDTLTRLQREAAETRKRSSELTDFGIGPSTTASAHSITPAKIGPEVFAELARVGERAKSGVERVAHAWEVLAGIAEEEASKRKRSGILDVAYQSGLSLLSTFGGAKGSVASGAIGAAMSGFAAGGPWGAAIAGVTSLTQGIFGLSKASKEAAAAQVAAQREFQTSFALYKKGAYGTITDTDRALDQARQQYEANEKQIQELYGGKKNETERERLLAENKRAYDAYIEQIKATAAEMDKAAKADGFRKSIEEFTRVIDSLQGFQNELKLGDLSPLSPTQKLAEAKRQYEEVLARARGGDISAADQIPQFARAFLEASRSVNASGGAYQRDFQRVQLDTDELSKMFESQRAIAQQQLDVLTGIRDGSAETAKQTHEDLVGVRDAIERLIDETQSNGEKVESVV